MLRSLGEELTRDEQEKYNELIRSVPGAIKRKHLEQHPKKSPRKSTGIQ
jgi:hypothetical protein